MCVHAYVHVYVRVLNLLSSLTKSQYCSVSNHGLLVTTQLRIQLCTSSKHCHLCQPWSQTGGCEGVAPAGWHALRQNDLQYVGRKIDVVLLWLIAVQHIQLTCATHVVRGVQSDTSRGGGCLRISLPGHLLFSHFIIILKLFSKCSENRKTLRGRSSGLTGSPP